MIGALKAVAKRHWPALRLRSILIAVLLVTAALPGFGAIFLRVYENTLVRQTEAELVAQGATLAAAAQLLWPGEARPAPPGAFVPETPTIDLSSTPILPERPRGARKTLPDPRAQQAAEKLSPIIEGAKRTTLASIIVLDRQGRVAIGPDAGAGHGALPEVRAALNGRPQTVLRRNGDYFPRYNFEWLSRAADLRVHHARPIVVGGEVQGVLLLSRSARALFKGLYQDRFKIALGVVVIFGLIVVMAGLVSRTITRPIEALSDASRQVAAGHGDIPQTPPTAAVEIRALYEDFRVMAEAISRRSRYLKDFAAAVSHEFKTPLAGIAGGVELLQDHEMSEAERARFLANMSADAARLSHLVSRLMDLARADMARPETGVAADPAVVARRVADALATPGFAVDLKLPAALPKVAAPEAAIEAALTCLIENSRQAGAGRAVVEARVEDGVVRLRVADDGPGVPAADRPRLFEPFFTSRRAEGGTGLGLAIARSLLTASHGDLTFVETPSGARFDVILPRAEEVV